MQGNFGDTIIGYFDTLVGQNDASKNSNQKG
jgi:hypothetical protein